VDVGAAASVVPARMSPVPATNATDPARVGLGVRLFAYALIVAVVFPVLTDTERWPFTTLRLFSFVRGPEQAGWELTMVSADGREQPFPWAELPATFAFRAHVLRRFPAMSTAERQAACDAWAEAADEDAARLLIHRVQRRTSTTGEKSTVVRRDLRYECDVGP
jgi:hypothetical protein